MGYYVDDLLNVVDIVVICEVGVWIGVDLFGGVSVDYWGEIVYWYGLDLIVVNLLVDVIWWFMILDIDGKIWMDCSLLDVMVGFI